MGMNGVRGKVGEEEEGGDRVEVGGRGVGFYEQLCWTRLNNSLPSLYLFTLLQICFGSPGDRL